MDSLAEQRSGWGNQIEFVMTCVGFAVGLGTVWRFPFLAYQNGGGAFLIPYFLMLFLVGIPIFFFELAIGQFASQGPTGIWRVSPLFKGVGWSMVIISWLIGVYYNVVVTYCMYFFFASMTHTLPWVDCENSWNTKLCFSAEEMKNGTAFNASMIERNISREQVKTAAEEYFYNKVLQMSPGIDQAGHVIWQLVLCLFLCWFIIFLVLIKGASSLGKVVYFTSIFPYILLTALLIRGATLDGASNGMEYYMTPDPSKLLDSQVWCDAATQIFYALSACTGGLIAMASYNSFRQNCIRDSVIVSLTTCFTCIFAGLVVFSVLGFMANSKGVPINQVVKEGPGLVFVVYPEALAQMPGANIWAMLFFFTIMTLGFSSQFPTLETIFCAIIDEFPETLLVNQKAAIIFRGVSCFASFLLTLPMVTQGGFYWFVLTDEFVGGFPLLIIGVLELLAIIIVYGYENFAQDIALMLGRTPGLYIRVTWCCVTPLVLFIIIILKSIEYTPVSLENYVYPHWAQVCGWLMVAAILVTVPLSFLIYYCQNGGYEVLKSTLRPASNWGPALRKHQVGKYATSSAWKKNSSQMDDHYIDKSDSGQHLSDYISPLSASSVKSLYKDRINNVGFHDSNTDGQHSSDFISRQSADSVKALHKDGMINVGFQK